MNLQQIQYFSMIAYKGNFTQAADELRVTQSTLSHSMRDLEKELNVSLLDRKGKTTTLTPFGEVFLEYTEPILQLLDEAAAKIREMSDPDQGVIAISYFSSLNDLVTYTVSSYFETCGKIQPYFRFFPSSTTQIEKAITDGDSDLAFTTEIANPNFEYFPIGYHEIVVIVSDKHPLAKLDSIDLKELQNEKLITYEGTCQIRNYINRILTSAGVKPRVIFETTDDNIIVSSVAANFGIALIPKPLGGITGAIKQLRIENDIPPRTIALAWRKGRYQSKAVENFAQFVTQNGHLFDRYLRRRAARGISQNSPASSSTEPLR